MPENKQTICHDLRDTLKLTRQYHDLLQLNYNDDKEIVEAVFEQGTKYINVAMDSESAMIRDIVNHLE